MYTFAALPDTSASHLGFYVVCVFFVVLGLFFFNAFLAKDATRNDLLGFAIIAAVIVAFVAAVSYSDRPPRNEPVIAVHDGYTADSVQHATGRITSTEHRLYAQFKVPGGSVALQVAPGQLIPSRVVLYKN